MSKVTDIKKDITQLEHDINNLVSKFYNDNGYCELNIRLEPVTLTSMIGKVTLRNLRVNIIASI